MKKILMTGMTRKQCYAEENLPETTKRAWNHINYASTPCSVELAFKLLGHEVDRRPVTPGEDLDFYDLVIVYISSMCSRISIFLYGALWAILQRPDAIWSIDDWQINEIQKNATTLRRGDHWNPAIKREDFELASGQYKAQLEEAAAKVALSNPWPRTLVPLFPWGNHRKLGLPLRKVLAFDPTSISGDLSSLIEHEPRAQGERDREWICATLGQRARRDKLIKDLLLSWPATTYGGKSEKKIDESELVHEYVRAWGSIVTPYPHFGSGWYRTRFLHAAHFKNVLLCHPYDAKRMGEPFLYVAKNLRAVEQLPAEQLNYIAQHQAQWFFENVWTKDQLLRAFDAVANAPAPSLEVV